VPYLILSDIHANLEALSAVLGAAAGRYDKTLCLGDLVGYGADPNPICEWSRANVTAIVRGNHDRACCGNESLEDYRPAAAASALWTEEQLAAANREYLEALPRGPLRYDDFDLTHGSPDDEDEYLITPADAAPLRDSLMAQLTFFGHTHVQGGFLVARYAAKRIPAPGVLELEQDHFYLVNPGSVGQPRDGDPRAAYAIYTPEQRIVEYFRVAYDIDKAASKIRAAGLPTVLAERLYTGV
jgi:diadenosine tetraphosphatase ApaH/serine/threonine PP2A family protein phosphatase